MNLVRYRCRCAPQCHVFIYLQLFMHACMHNYNVCYITFRVAYSLDDDQSVRTHHGAGSDHESSSSEGE